VAVISVTFILQWNDFNTKPVPVKYYQSVTVAASDLERRVIQASPQMFRTVLCLYAFYRLFRIQFI